ncbi:MAG: site-specific integrase, partial [Sphingomonas fennica]
LSARWQDLDVNRRQLFVPTSKTGRSRHVPLSQAALDVIAGLGRGAAFLFPNPRDPSKHLTTIKHGFQSAREAAGLPDLHIHDLRHTAASAMVAAGVDLFAVGKVLGHANVASTARYSHLANDTLLRAVEAGAARLAAAA